MKFKSIFVGLTLGLVACKPANDLDWFKTAVDQASFQMEHAAQEYKPGQNPRSIEPDGSVRLASPKDWTCGFFPGSLWYTAQLTGDKKFQGYAKQYTEALEEVKDFKHTHDLGFMIFCSYGNGYKQTHNPAYKKVVEDASRSLISRYNPKVGCIRSWDFGEWQYPVIIDNMMNLEMLFWASKETGDKSFRNIAVQHAKTTMKNHFRKDYTSYHVLSYDTISGNVISKGTFQGFSDESAWSRGQGWGVYGYTVAYRETKNPEFLAQAQHIAKMIMHHPRTPEDRIPYWDYDAPDIPNAPRDASAAAVIASGLLELSTMVEDGSPYFHYAETLLKNLSKAPYLAEKGTNKFFVLKHCTGAYPNNSEIDVPINYGDYYYLEALVRYAKLKNIDVKSL